MVYIKTHIFNHFFQQCLVLLTMVPRNIGIFEAGGACFAVKLLKNLYRRQLTLCFSGNRRGLFYPV